MNYLEAAAALGRRLVHQASWDGPQCTWEIAVSDRTAGERRAKSQRTGGTLYQGTSGIAWFLAELSAATGEDSFAHTAAGALRHALDDGATKATNNFGFHSGRVGIAYVATRLAHLLHRDELPDRAWQLLEPLLGQEHHDHGIDVIAGAAGAIPALLELRTTLGREELLTMARALGDRLIALAHREPTGWSWRTMKGSAVRNLNGLAHGSSGIALGLLELAAATGEGKYLCAAELAFLYERQFFDEEAANWPDWRNQAIGEYTYSGRMDALRKDAAEGRVPGYHLHHMAAWCHGSPGIGLARLRAFELTGQTLYRDEARAALPPTLHSIEQAEFGMGNYSLCHGIAGNCEFPLVAASILEEPSLIECCEHALAGGWATYGETERPWPTGAVNAVPDPSLLLGEAGIGFFFLRLAAARGQGPDIPSPLLLRPPGEVAPRSKMAEGYETLAREVAEEYFTETLEAWRNAGLDHFDVPVPNPGDAPLATAPAEAAFRALKDTVEAHEGARREKLEDAFLVERECFERTRGIQDFTVEFLYNLVRTPWEEIETANARFQRGLGGHLLATEEAYFLLYRKENRVRSQPVGPFAALILDAVESPATLAEIVDRIAQALDGGEIDRAALTAAAFTAALTAKVLPQIEQLHRAGFVDAAPP